MSTSAASLLDILRGHKPPPASPHSPSSAATAPTTTTTQGQAPSSPSAPTTTTGQQPQQQSAQPPGQPQLQGQQQPQPTDLDRLFHSAFSTTHPSSAPSPSPVPSSSLPHQLQGIIERPPVSPSRSPVLNGNGAGGGAAEASQSNSLLSLLQGMGGGGGGGGGTAEKEKEKQGYGEKQNGAVGGGAGNQAARDLLATLMGGGGGGQVNGATRTAETEEVQQSPNGQQEPSPSSPAPNPTSPSPPASLPSPVPTPKFAPFISPFDLLARAHAAEQASLPPSSSPVSAPAPAPAPGTTKSAIPPHLLPTPLSRPSSAASSDAYSSDGGAPSAPSSLPPTTAAGAGGGGGGSTLLASQYLALTPPSTPSSSPGLALPSTTEPQHLTISLSLPHLDSLSPSLPTHTPITLFPVPPLYASPGSASRVGIWERGIVYSTAKGRIRVIGREKGARGLLRGHEGVGDLRVAAGEARTRVVGSTGVEGRVCVWRIGESENGEITHSRLLLLSSPPSPTSTPASSTRFPFLRFHPHFPTNPLLALAVNDGRVFLLDLSSVLESEGGVEGGEELLYSLGKGVQCGGTITDLAFSPDGSAIVVLLADGSYSIRRSEKPSQVVLEGQVPPAAEGEGEGEGELDGVSFLSPSGSEGRPTALLISSKRGTFVRILPLRSRSSAAAAAASTSINLTLPPTTSTDIDPQTHFSHHAYHHHSQSLYLSSSLRGSLFAFRLAFAPRQLLLGKEADSDADFLSLLNAIAGAREEGVRVSHVMEVPTEGRVLGFVLDEEIEEEGRMGALVVHEGGVHQVVFERPSPSSLSEAEQAGERDGEGEGEGEGEEGEVLGPDAPRRMSLESSILVSEEVQVVVDEADPLALAVDGGAGGGGGAAINGTPASDSPRRNRAPSFSNINSHSREPAVTPIQEETPSISPPPPPAAAEDKPLDSPSASGAFITSPSSPSLPTSSAQADALAQAQAEKVEIKLSGSAVNAAIRSMKAKNKEKDKSAPGTSSPTASPASPAAAAAARDPIANAWATGVAPATTAKKGKGGKEGNEEVLRELRKLEESLPGKIAKVVGREMEKHAQRAEEDKLQDLAADTARQETMLKLVSTTLSKNTSRLVEAAIKEQVKSQVVPSIGRIVAGAVQEQIGRGIKEGLKETLPNEIEKLLYRPDLVAHLSRNFSTTLAPSLERSLSSIVTNGVIPAFNASLNGAVEACMEGVRREMVDVRKEIVKEQSEAVVELEEEVHALRGDVVDLKAALERMEAVVASLAGRQQPLPPPAPQTQQYQQTPQHPQQQQRQVSGPPPSQALSPQHRQQPQQQQQSPYSLPPIPRVPTPPQAYEEMFTNALLPQHEPTFASLVHLINSSPPTRLETIFPPAPQPPKLSPAVILSLAFRLSEVIAATDGPLEEEGRRQLHWVRKCLTAMDGKSPELTDFTPRILDSVITSLHNRCKRLHAMGDKRGMEESRTVEQYARAQQRLFASEQARETFRR